MVDSKHVFEKLILSSKSIFVILLLVLAFINGHGTYICKNPRRFMSDAIVIPLTACLATWFMAYNRGSEVLTKVFITFLFFFFFQVCRELSGYYAFEGSEIKNETEKKQSSKKNLMIAGAIIAVVSLILFFLSYRINEPYPLDAKFSFLFESVVFIFLLTIGETSVGITHGQKPLELFGTVASSVAMFAAVQVCLQKGGFYEHVFKPKIITDIININYG